MSCPPPTGGGTTISASDPAMVWGSPGNSAQICPVSWTVRYGGHVYTIPGSGCGGSVTSPQIPAICNGTSSSPATPTTGTASYVLAIPPEPGPPAGWHWTTPPPGPPASGPHATTFSVPACEVDAQKPVTSVAMRPVGYATCRAGGACFPAAPRWNVVTNGTPHSFAWRPVLCCGVSPMVVWDGWASLPWMANYGPTVTPQGPMGPGNPYPRWIFSPLNRHGAQPGAFGPANNPPEPVVRVALHAPSSAGASLCGEAHPRPGNVGPFCMHEIGRWTVGWGSYAFRVTATPTDNPTTSTLPIWRTVTYACVRHHWRTVRGKRVDAPSNSTCQRVDHSSTSWQQPAGFGAYATTGGLVETAFTGRTFVVPVTVPISGVQVRITHTSTY